MPCGPARQSLSALPPAEPGNLHTPVLKCFLRIQHCGGVPTSYTKTVLLFGTAFFTKNAAATPKKNIYRNCYTLGDVMTFYYHFPTKKQNEN